MATLKTIRKRIVSTKNTQKITKAMKMVSAAKLRRAQTALTQARPHRAFLMETLSRMVTDAEAWEHPFLRGPDEPKRAEILVISSDRGLCGGFNSNLLRKVDAFTRHQGKSYEQIGLNTVGRKGRDYYRAKKKAFEEIKDFKPEAFTFEQARNIASDVMKRYVAGEFDVFFVAYNSFKSAISQEPTILPVLPLDIPRAAEDSAPIAWEGSKRELLELALHRMVATLIYLSVLESQASELGSRMSAMENATNNAKDMIGALTLQYNRARQASITKELMDIVNGAESLK